MAEGAGAKETRSGIGTRTVRRNYYLGMANGGLHMMGVRLIDPYLVLAAYVYERTRSPVLVGLLAAFTTAGMFWPQLYMSSAMEHCRRKKPFYLVSSAVRVAMLLCMAAAMWFGGTEGRAGWLVVFFAAWFILRSAQGVGALPFMDIVGQTISPRRLGGFFALRNMLGEGLALFAGFLLVQPIIKHVALPGNYVLLTLMGMVVMGAGWGMWIQAYEEENENPPQRRSFRETCVAGVQLLKVDANYRLLLALRFLMRVNILMLIFYVPYGVERLGAIGMAGVFVGFMSASRLLSLLVWGRLSNAKGNRVCLVGSALLFALSPLVALAAPYLPEAFHWSVPILAVDLNLPLSAYLIALCVVALALAGYMVASDAFLLESAPSDRRPSYIAFLNTVTFPASFLAVLAGAVIDPKGPSLEVLFAVVAFSGFLTLLVTLRLREVREAS